MTTLAVVLILYKHNPTGVAKTLQGQKQQLLFNVLQNLQAW